MQYISCINTYHVERSSTSGWWSWSAKRSQISCRLHVCKFMYVCLYVSIELYLYQYQYLYLLYLTYVAVPRTEAPERRRSAATVQAVAALSLAEVAAASQAEVLAAKDVEGESGRSGDVLKMGRPLGEIRQKIQWFPPNAIKYGRFWWLKEGDLAEKNEDWMGFRHTSLIDKEGLFIPGWQNIGI